MNHKYAVSTLVVGLLILAPPHGAWSADIPLEWDANAESDLAGYRLYQATNSLLGMTTQQAAADSLVTKVSLSTATSYSMPLLEGATYFFRLTAFDTSSNESGFNVDGSNLDVEVSTYVPLVPDISSPTVSITFPGDGATVSGMISLTASAADNRGVFGVQFQLDGSNLGLEDTSSPYSIPWDTASASEGSHTLTARARDAAGNSTSVTITVTVSRTVDTISPVVSVISPTDGAQINPAIDVQVSISDNLLLQRVELWDNGSLVLTKICSPQSGSYYGTLSWQATHLGSQTLQVKAYDTSGNMGASALLTVTVNRANRKRPVSLVKSNSVSPQGVVTPLDLLSGNVAPPRALMISPDSGYNQSLVFDGDVTEVRLIDLTGHSILHEVQSGGAPIIINIQEAAGNLRFSSGLSIAQYKKSDGTIGHVPVVFVK
ncbi:MAG: hypothetical protein HY399_08160 [Elusimicrobia bacterium]|nr:hypothetical protein [Elusimicrobiota bacterium]